jgi:Rhamnosyl O-methyltransferase/CmcI
MSRDPVRSALRGLSRSAKRFTVRTVKPLVSEPMWQWLRGPLAAVPADQRAGSPGELESREPEHDLTWWAAHHRTDKWSARHRYTPHYERHLGYLRDEKFTLFEIGIGGYRRERTGGASLRMWRDYFPHAHVVGLDIEDKSFVDDDRITTYRGSQTDAQLLRWIVESWPDVRVVVDDGSHRNDHVLASFEVLFPLLPAGGHYVIEDTQTSYWPRFGGSTDPAARDTSMGLTKRLVDGLNYEEYTDEGYEPSYTELHVRGVHAYHNLVFVDKGLNAEGRGPQRHD